MQKNFLSVGSAALISMGIALIMHLFFLIIFVYGRDAVIPSDAPPRPEKGIDAGKMAFSFMANFVFCFILFLVNFAVLRSRVKAKIPLLIIAVLIASFILNYVSTQLQIEFFGGGPRPERMVRGNLFRDGFLTLTVVLSSQILHLSSKKQQIALLNETLVAENVKTRYLALRNQIDPHFLFNTLGALTSMIKIDSDKAQEYVQKLSSVFRYTLQGSESVSLRRELDFTYDYCSLMQIRYGDNLRFLFEVDERYLEYAVAPLSVQVLVENAVKHNVISNRTPFEVRVYTDQQRLCVTNLLQPKKEPETGSGIGLANLAERYRLKWDREIEVSDDGLSFTVCLPLIETKNDESWTIL